MPAQFHQQIEDNLQLVLLVIKVASVCLCWRRKDRFKSNRLLLPHRVAELSHNARASLHHFFSWQMLSGVLPKRRLPTLKSLFTVIQRNFSYISFPAKLVTKGTVQPHIKNTFHFACGRMVLVQACLVLEKKLRTAKMLPVYLWHKHKHIKKGGFAEIQTR